MLVMNLHNRACSEPLTAMPSWLRRLTCERLASLVHMKTSAQANSTEAPDVSVALLDVTVPNDTKQLDQTFPSSAAAAVSAVERLLASINDKLETRLRSDAQLRHETEKNQQMMNEWMIAAAVIDRTCFIVFSITLAIGSFIFYLLFLARP